MLKLSHQLHFSRKTKNVYAYILTLMLNAIIASANSSKLRFPELSLSASLMMN